MKCARAHPADADDSFRLKPTVPIRLKPDSTIRLKPDSTIRLKPDSTIRLKRTLRLDPLSANHIGDEDFDQMGFVPAAGRACAQHANGFGGIRPLGPIGALRPL